MRLLNFALASLAIVAHGLLSVSACPAKATGGCINPPTGNWKDFKNFFQGKTGRVVLCPFQMNMAADDAPIRLKKQHEYVCAVDGGCEISGGKSHIKVTSFQAAVSIRGFKFTDASAGSFFIAGTARNFEHTICHSTFESNNGRKGSAVRVFDGTKANIVETKFINNSAKIGTIHSGGDVKISGCDFVGNTAKKDGSALYLLEPDGTTSVGNTAFVNNDGGNDFISGAATFNNIGGNTGSGNSGRCGANGAYLRTKKECVNFGAKPPTPQPPTPQPPTPQPPTGKYPAHPKPKNPPAGYFNYDVNDMEHGPNAWHKIPAQSTYEFKFWKNIGLDKYLPADMGENTCNSQKSFNNNYASPVNLRNTDDNCKEFHQKRPNRNTRHMPIVGPPGVIIPKAKIKPWALRLEYPDVGKENLEVPSIDIPFGWGKFLHVVYCELKVPGGHTMQGRKFDAEMNCFIIQKSGGRGLAAVTYLFEIGNHNKNLEHFLTAFQGTHETNRKICGGRRTLEVVDGDGGNSTVAEGDVSTDGIDGDGNSTVVEDDVSTDGMDGVGNSTVVEDDVSTDSMDGDGNSTVVEDDVSTDGMDGDGNSTVVEDDVSTDGMDGDGNSNVTGDGIDDTGNSTMDDTNTTDDIGNDISEQDLIEAGDVKPPENDLIPEDSTEDIGNNISEQDLIEANALNQNNPFWMKGWNPFEFMYQTDSWWFYGYRGGFMVPPCNRVAEYRVMDTPNEMSRSQLEEIKRLLFTNRDPNDGCRYSSVHNNNESVQRELQPSKRSRIHRCTCRDFLDDKTRDRTGLRTCPKGAECKWMPNCKDLKVAPGEQWDEN